MAKENDLEKYMSLLINTLSNNYLPSTLQVIKKIMEKMSSMFGSGYMRIFKKRYNGSYPLLIAIGNSYAAADALCEKIPGLYDETMQCIIDDKSNIPTYKNVFKLDELNKLVYENEGKDNEIITLMKGKWADREDVQEFFSKYFVNQHFRLDDWCASNTRCRDLNSVNTSDFKSDLEYMAKNLSVEECANFQKIVSSFVSKNEALAKERQEMLDRNKNISKKVKSFNHEIDLMTYYKNRITFEKK